MARQVLPIVGAVVGAYFGAPQLGYVIGSLVGNAVDPQVIKGPKIGDAGIQTSAEGVFRPVVYGTGAVMGNVIERGNRKITKRRTQQGKGGPVTEEERVSWTFAIRLAEGPITSVLRIWEDEKLVYDTRSGSPIPEETADFSERCRIYLGDEDQLPDPDLEAYKGLGNVNAYRGTAYIVFPNYDLTDRRESIPNYRFEVVGMGAPVTWSPKIITDGGYYTGSFSSPVGQIADSAFGFAYPSSIKPLGCSPDGLLAAAACLVAPYLRVFSYDKETSSWEPVTVTGDLPDGVAYTAAFSPDGRWIVVGSSGTKRLHVYEVADGLVSYFGSPPSGATDSIVFAKFSPQNSRLFACIAFSSPVIRLFEIGSTEVTLQKDSGSYSATAGTASMLAWRPDGGMVAFLQSPTFAILETESLGVVFEQDLGDLSIHPDHVMWSAALDFFYFVEGTSAVLSVFRWIQIGEGIYELDRYPDPVQPSGPISGADMSFDGRYVLLNSNDVPGGINVYRTNLMNSLEYLGHFGSGTARTMTLVEGPSIPFGTPSSLPLADIVSAICERSKVASADVDVTQLGDLVEGMVLAGDYTCADAIKAIMPVYTFDSSEHDNGSGYKIRFIKRGRPVLYTLENDDFITVEDKTIRQDSLERPRVLHLSYQNPTIGYAPAKASPSRNSPDVNVVGEISAQIPVSFGNVDEAWQRADVLLKQAWVEIGGEEEFTVSYSNLDLVPTDVIGVAIRDQVRRLRVVQVGAVDGSIQLKLIADRQSAYTSNITGVPVPEPTPPPPSIVGQTIHWPLDIPALNDNNDRLLTYGAATGQAEAWYGALVQRSRNGGVSWEDAATFRVNSIMGILVNTVSDASPHYTDTTNEIVVDLYLPDAIESISEQEFLSEGGALALSWENSHGRQWEILQYRDALQNSDGTWTLSTLLRGRLNTETAQHPTGSLFVLLDTVQPYENTTGDIGTDISYRAISLGNSPEGATVYTEEYTGQSQREWPVASLILTSPSAGSVVATAIPRNRFGTEDNPIKSVNWTGYRWTATDGTNIITRDTIDQTTTFDTTGWSSPVTVTVAQMNRITGPGPTVSEHIA